MGLGVQKRQEKRITFLFKSYEKDTTQTAESNTLIYATAANVEPLRAEPFNSMQLCFLFSII